MLNKLLKYDFKALLRIWWFAAAASVLISIAGGFCSKLFFAERDFPYTVEMMSYIIFIAAIFASCALVLLTFVMVFSRFYRNFFSDEGYLTFTLPVSRRTLLNSKVICGTVAMFVTALICLFNIALMVWIGNAQFLMDTFRDIRVALAELCGTYLMGHVPLAILLAVLCVLCAVLFLYTCVTFAAMVVRKAKLFAAIAIYYGANSLVTFAIQIFQLFGISSVTYWLEQLNFQQRNQAVLLMLLAACLTTAIVSGVLYILQLMMLERKLNLN